MTIRIVTDSTCDLPPEVIEENNITVVPLYINIGDEGYMDGVEMTRKEFYTGLPTYKPFPTTATPGADVFQKIYHRLAEEGATQILSIHISIKLSATLDVARLAAREIRRIPVTVFDSRQLSLGTGFIVEAAARAARLGQPLKDILTHLEQLISRTHVIASLDTLEFLRRSGRMNGAVAGIGSLLQLKPILKMFNGLPTSEKVRTQEKADQRVLDLLRSLVPLERVALVHTNAREKAERLLAKAQDILPGGDIWSMDITPVIGAHIGPGAVGFAAISKSST